MFPENVFKRVPAELPAGQCSHEIEIRLWKLCLRCECVQNCGTMFFLPKHDQTYFFSEHLREQCLQTIVFILKDIISESHINSHIKSHSNLIQIPPSNPHSNHAFKHAFRHASNPHPNHIQISHQMPCTHSNIHQISTSNHTSNTHQIMQQNWHQMSQQTTPNTNHASNIYKWTNGNSSRNKLHKM